MFELLEMIGTYSQRVVANDDCELFTLDTVRITDREKDYETAVKHKYFNQGEWIVLEWSDTKEEALETHKKWLEYFRQNEVEEIEDCFSGEVFKREREE